MEIDGSQHYTDEGKAYDAERTAILESFGYKVLRFSNDDIDHSFDHVCFLIDKEVKERLKALSAGGEGVTK